jgi:diguanylate cyclase (GGDEF)-like protein
LSLAAQKKLPDVGGEANSLLQLGDTQMQEARYHAALSSGQQLTRIGMDTHNNQMQSDALHLQAGAYNKLGNFKQAYDVLEHASTLDKKVRGENNQQYIAQMHDEAIRSQNSLLATQLQINQLKARRAAWIRNLIVIVLFIVILLSAAIVLYQRRISRQLQHLSTTDPLTGLLNRRGVTQALNDRTAALGSEEPSAAIFLIDADHFKSVNDRFGHAVGDLVLKELAVRIKQTVRTDDLVARWGGEEFLVCAWDMAQEEASSLAARLCSSIGAKSLTLPNAEPLSVSVSLGFVFHPFFSGKSPARFRETIYMADRALYAAKHSGRNCWVGLQRKDLPPHVSVNDIHDNIAQAIEKHWVQTLSEQEIRWDSSII